MDLNPPPPNSSGAPRLPKRSTARRIVNRNAKNEDSQTNTDNTDLSPGRDPNSTRDKPPTLSNAVLPPIERDMAGGKKGEKVLNLGQRVRYPIKITKLYKRPGDQIKHGDPVLQYSFTWETTLVDQFQEEKKHVETSLTDWDAPEEGKLLSWHVKEGDEIARNMPCITVEEACTHELQFNGLCALCGKDMTEVKWASEQRDSDRAPINMIHDETRLTVSKSAAAKAEADLQQRLLSTRKLSLVVDLDQTIIHACIEPTVGEWQQDPENPNYESVKDVKKFQLEDGPRGLASGCWYYIKLRPGLVDFLKNINTMYELHVYTMGTRAYAEHIAEIVDPGKTLFANRVISRDENGNMIAKSLQRLFPVSTNMVVIIDDRADVWPYNRPNLIKVNPYDFFKGIGDINSSFLPKRQDIVPAATPTPPVNGSAPPAAKNGQVNGAAKVSALESLASIGGGENPALLKKQTEEQERELEQQLKDRPLQHLQEQLDKEDEEATQKTEVNGEEPSSSPPAHRHQLLLDDDEELFHIEKHLTNVHNLFYKEFDAMREEAGSKSDSPVPDVGEVMDRIKSKVFAGLTIVTSGIVPLGIDVERSEIGLQAKTFGARLQNKISKSVTHLVISSDRPRTQKVRQAVMYPNIKIVNQNWLADCLGQWRRLDEAPYLVRAHPYDQDIFEPFTDFSQVDIHPSDRAKISALGTPADTTDADTASVESDVDDDTPGMKKSKPSNLKIVVTKPSGNGDDDDEDDIELDEQMSPMEELKSLDWTSIEEELDEFLASDDSDDDEDGDEDGEDEGDKSDAEDAPTSGTKRKFDEPVEDDSSEVSTKKTKLDNGAQESTGPSLSADDARVLGSLKNYARSGATVSSNKGDRGPDDDHKLDFDHVPSDDDDDALEADLLAELEAEEEAERQQGL